LCFVHIAPDNNNSENTDFVMFVLESQEDNIFYNISAISPFDKRLEKENGNVN